MVESHFGVVGRTTVIALLLILASALGLGGLSANVFFVNYLLQSLPGQGIIYFLFVFSSFAIIGVVGGIAHFILDKVFEKVKKWWENRKG